MESIDIFDESNYISIKKDILLKIMMELRDTRDYNNYIKNLKNHIEDETYLINKIHEILNK